MIPQSPDGLQDSYKHIGQLCNRLPGHGGMAGEIMPYRWQYCKPGRQPAEITCFCSRKGWLQPSVKLDMYNFMNLIYLDGRNKQFFHHQGE